jgi:hypothetical protein
LLQIKLHSLPFFHLLDLNLGIWVKCKCFHFTLVNKQLCHKRLCLNCNTKKAPSIVLQKARFPNKLKYTFYYNELMPKFTSFSIKFTQLVHIINSMVYPFSLPPFSIPKTCPRQVLTMCLSQVWDKANKDTWGKRSQMNILIWCLNPWVE